jgi:hypothetical protein
MTMPQQRNSRPSPALHRELEVIAELPLGDLRKRWVAATGRPAPRPSTKMLRLALGHEIQAKALGGMSREARRQLDGANSRPQTPALLPGARLVREWGGKIHVVSVAEDGSIHWNERTWDSLSQVARAITGTRWSGPAFFGLRKAA